MVNWLHGALVALAVLDGACGGVNGPLPEVVDPSRANALARGAAAPKLDELYQAGLRAVIDSPAGPPVGAPARVCVGAPIDPNMYWLPADPAPEVLAGQIRQDLRLEGLAGCADPCRLPTWSIAFGSIQRWWDTPDEYELDGEVIADTDAEMGHLHSAFTVIAVRQGGLWRVSRVKTAAE